MTTIQSSLITSFILTLLIFIIGILTNYALDFYRIDAIEEVFTHYELDTASYRTEQALLEHVEGSICSAKVRRLDDLKQEIRKVGIDLASYSSYSFFNKKDYDHLKRKYFLLQIQFYTLLKDLSTRCDRQFIPILFFYQIDDDASERQGYVLTELSKEHHQVAIISLDKNYADEPLVTLLALKYNITTAPTLIIDDIKQEGYHSTGELNSTINKLLRTADPHARDKDFTYVPKSAGTDITAWSQELLAQTEKNITPYAKGDILLAVGRILDNTTLICQSLSYYDQAKATTPEEQALLYETSASLGCGRNRQAFLKEAARTWEKQDVKWRANIYNDLAQGRTPQLNIQPATIQPSLPNRTATKVTIGTTHITIPPNARITTQADRVTRDWLGRQLNQTPTGPNILTTMTERLTYTPQELRADIGWHEGGRLANLLTKQNITMLSATSVIAAHKDGKWYASDEQGIFRFEIPLDKILYPTTRFLTKNLAIVVDTHGTNMLVEHAIRNKADIVISDCDHPGKVAAAAHLSNKGIPVICYPDKYVHLAIGNNISLIGSPPFSATGAGGRPITITTKDKILVVNATNQPYALWYYQTPTHYFETLTQAIQLNITYFTMTDFNQQDKAIKTAENINANIIATRAFNMHDYKEISTWLSSDKKRKAILYHSASYPAGQLLFNEFPEQTTFNDPNPRFE